MTARLQQVRSELPAEAEPPVVEVQRADRPDATFYVSFTSTAEFSDLIVADRGGAIGRLRDGATVELGAEEADMVAKAGEKEAVYLGIWPLIGVNEIDVSHRLKAEMERIRPTLPPDTDMQMAYNGTIPGPKPDRRRHGLCGALQGPGRAMKPPRRPHRRGRGRGPAGVPERLPLPDPRWWLAGLGPMPYLGRT